MMVEHDHRSTKTSTVDAVDHAQFVQAVTAFLEAHAKPATTVAQLYGEGSDAINIFANRAESEVNDELRRGREWRSLLFDAGYGWITGPVEYGGAGLTPHHEELFAAVAAGFDTPSQDLFLVSLAIVAPTIAAFGQDAVKAKYLRGLYRGDLIACQLFSEPNAGSDLASLRTRAVPRQGGWLVSGQKVWTSEAHQAQLGLLLARTGSEAARHRGITAFMVDMGDPAIDIRPLRQMNGESHFNEVFIDDLFVPDDHRLGEVDDGWRVTLSTLSTERTSIGARGGSAEQVIVDRLFQMSERYPAQVDALGRQKLATVYCSARVLEWTNSRLADAATGSIASMGKLLKIRLQGQIMDAAAHLLGPAMVADTGAWGTFAWGNALLNCPGQRIAGGTDEIQRNTLGERVLGLPREPRLTADRSA